MQDHALLDHINHIYTDPAYSSACLGLSYCSEQGAGYSRRKWGRGFSYYNPTGQLVKSKALKKRFKALAIPPAWQEVWISEDELSHLQASGLDAAQRKQYLYHPTWLPFRNRVKFYHLLNFASALPRIRRQALKDFREQDPLSRKGILATMILLLDKGALRIGNETYYKERETVGLTTLEKSHVHIEGPQIHLEYIGKSLQERQIHLQDQRLSERFEQLLTLPGDRLFTYDHKGQLETLSSAQVNHFLQAHSPYAISAKDFRTWKGTQLALKLMLKHAGEQPQPPLKAIVEPVAQALGNTPAVAQSSYIHPDLLALWQNEEFLPYYQQLKHLEGRSYFHKIEVQLEWMLRKLVAENPLGHDFLQAA